MTDLIKTNLEEMVEITIAGQTVVANKSLIHFLDLMKSEGIEIKDVNQLVFDYMKFIHMWKDFKTKSDQENSETDFEKELNKHIIAHTIKPKTQYAHQQQMKDGKTVLYPVYFFDRDNVHSMGVGGNYPIKECNFFVKTKRGDYVKIN